jgi:hypothetical protein
MYSCAISHNERKLDFDQGFVRAPALLAAGYGGSAAWGPAVETYQRAYCNRSISQGNPAYVTLLLNLEHVHF